MPLNTIEYVHFEDAPYVECNAASAEIAPEYTSLPTPFLAALRVILAETDETVCQNCEGGVGWVLMEDSEGFERLIWRITSLARENSGPIVMLCDDCAPFVPAPREMTLTLFNRSEMAVWLGTGARLPDDPGSDVLLVDAPDGKTVCIVLGETVKQTPDGFQKVARS